ncbi:hypothetical protein [Aldersonia kunmingensis]|uniref:hypothetical protein n=1 Tax=Aldersonia kunmingensis TaxID=408066 RepID=UPI00082DD79D|nr:hypothetical protein [Aldersonia kunmingensis]
MNRPGLGAFVLVASCLALAACGSDSDSDTSSAESHASALEQAASGTTGATAGSAEADIDACALLSDEDVAPLIGTTVPGQSTSTDPELPGCTWENPETYTSVSIDISNPGTAPDNTLPEPDPALQTRPAPDGMRYYMTGAVEFAADDRVVSVQVANLSSAEESDAAALALANKIKAEMS